MNNDVKSKIGITISDLDGSLLESIFLNDGSQDQESAEFQDVLLAVPAFPWVNKYKIKLFQQARVVMFVTGRGIHLNPVTTTWIAENLEIKEFQIINVRFTTYKQYIEEKETAIDKIIDEYAQKRESPTEHIHIIEDDPKIIKWLIMHARCIEGIEVHAILENGNHSIAFPF